MEILSDKDMTKRTSGTKLPLYQTGTHLHNIECTNEGGIILANKYTNKVPTQNKGNNFNQTITANDLKN